MARDRASGSRAAACTYATRFPRVAPCCVPSPNRSRLARRPFLDGGYVELLEAQAAEHVHRCDHRLMRGASVRAERDPDGAVGASFLQQGSTQRFRTRVDEL